MEQAKIVQNFGRNLRFKPSHVYSPINKDELIDTLKALFKPIAPTVIFSKNQPGQYNLKSITPEDIGGMEPTYWQHRGVGYGMDPQLRTPYQSSRVNGLIKKDYSHVVGKLSIEIDASKYVGKKIKYVAWAKKGDVPLEKAYLRLALEKSDGTSDFGSIYLTSSSSNSILNNTVTNSGRSGIHLKSSSNDNKIYGNTVSSSHFHGLYVQSSDSAIIRNNTFSSSSMYGIKVSSSDTVVVDNNTLSSNSNYAIYFLHI